MQIYQIEKTYPEPKNLTPNIHYAKLLSNSLSGDTSELTAITQYIYHQLEASRSHPEAAEVLKRIAIVEMHHLELIGKCIYQFGGKPEYRYYHGPKPKYWNAGFLCYGENLKQMIRADIGGEYDTIEQYKHMIHLIKEPEIQALLFRIIEDEALHIEILEELLKEI